MLYIVGGIADRYGIRAGPADHGAGVHDRRADPLVRAAVREVRHQPACGRSTAAQAEVRYQRSRGEVKLLLVRNARRELRQRPGAVRRRTSRSTKARSSRCSAPTAPASRRCSRPSAGLVPRRRGAIVFDGRDMHATRRRTRSRARRRAWCPAARRVPVADRRREPRGSRAGPTSDQPQSRERDRASVLEMFPVLRDAGCTSRGGNLSRRPAADARRSAWRCIAAAAA